MAQNSLYPGFVLMKYEVQNLEHRATIPCIPVFDAGNWKLDTKGGTLVTLLAGTVAYISEIKALYAAEDTFTETELWTYDDPEGDPIFQTTIIHNIAGTSTGTFLAGQAVYGIRTNGGGLMRPTLMESNLALDVQLNYNQLGTSISKDIVDYITSNDSWLVGRDGAYAIGLVHLTTKKNDHLRKIRFGIN